MKSFLIDINPDILKWSMETINMPEDLLIKKLGINRTKFENWLNKRDKPTYVQLQKLAKIVSVSPLVFIADKIPRDKPMSVFRLYNGVNKKSFKTLKTIKKIKFLQNVAVELYDNLHLNTNPNIERYNIESNPEDIAKTIRKNFIDFDEQAKTKSKYELLNKFRIMVESNNVITMQFPFDDIRGFSLLNEKPHFIVLNSKEDPAAKIFTLFHEYGHILLGVNESDEVDYYTNKDRIEEWCNTFASYFLISDEIIQESYNTYNNIDDTIEFITKKYKLSRLMIKYRLSKLSYGNYDQSEFYQIKGNKKNKEALSGGNYYRTIKARYGDKFIDIINENYKNDYITLSDALTYLGMKVNSYTKLIEMVNL